MEKKPITPVAAGLIIGLATIVLFLIYYFTGLIFQQGIVVWLPLFVYVVLIVVFISMWSNAKNNFVTFGSCFGFGFRTVCIAALVSLLFTLVFIYLSPDYKDQMLRMMKDRMRENKQATDDQIDAGMNMITSHFMLITLGGSILSNVFFGIIAALIGAGVAKKKPFDPFTQINQIGEPQA